VAGLEDPAAHAPAEIGEDVEAIGASAGRVVCLARSGDRDRLAALDLASGARGVSIDLPRGEHFPGGGLVAGSRAIVASDRTVHLFDLARDLYLLDAVALEGADVDPASGIAARGERVYVASERVLWILRAR